MCRFIAADTYNKPYRHIATDTNRSPLNMTNRNQADGLGVSRRDLIGCYNIGNKVDQQQDLMEHNTEQFQRDAWINNIVPFLFQQKERTGSTQEDRVLAKLSKTCKFLNDEVMTGCRYWGAMATNPNTSYRNDVYLYNKKHGTRPGTPKEQLADLLLAKFGDQCSQQ